MWNDRDINIKWTIDGMKNILLSEKDKNHPNLKDLDLNQYPHFNICQKEV